MDRFLIFLGFIILVIVKIFLCIGILIISPILLFVNEDNFFSITQKLHNYINNE